MRVTVVINGEIGIRVAHVVAALDSTNEVSLYGATESKVFGIVDDLSGAEVVIADEGDEVPSGNYRVISPSLGPVSQVWGCAPVGLALALATRLDNVETIAACQELSGSSATNGTIGFPDPVGRRRTTTTEIGGREVRIASPIGSWSAVRVDGDPKSLGTVDDTRFLRAVTLAAGIGVEAGRAPWEDPERYLSTCRDAGVVFAEVTEPDRPNRGRRY